MTTKGTFTQIGKNDSGETKVLRRRVFYTDGYDAWGAYFANVGETDKRSGKPTSYAFTYDQDKGVIYLSEGYRDQSRKDTVRERTLNVNWLTAGQILKNGISLSWLTEEEMADLIERHDKFVTERAGEPPFGGDTGNDADMTPEQPEGTREQEEGEIRWRCPGCGHLLRKGRKSHICPDCGEEAQPVTV